MTSNKILFISMHLPSNTVPQAGQKLVMNKLNKLCAENEVFLISFCNSMEKSYLNLSDYDKCSQVHVFNITNSNRLINLLSNPTLPMSVAIRNDYRIRQVIKKILDENEIDAIHIEYEQGSVFIPKGFNGEVSVMFHDVISQSLSRFHDSEKNPLKKIIKKIELKRTLEWEGKVIHAINKIFVLNEKDKKLINSISSESKEIVVEYPEIAECFYNASRSKRESGCFLFWGAMNRRENVDAVLWFYEEMFPDVLKKIPHAKFYIVGANPPEEIKRLSSSNVIVTGFVDDPIPHFEVCSVAVVPLRFGAGIKLKTLETIAAGLVTISTSVGSEGIVESDFLKVADNSLEFSRNVIDSLSAS